MKKVRKENLDIISQKLLEGFNYANFTLLHLSGVRYQYRKALFDRLKEKYQESIKIIDKDLSITTNLSWYNYGKGSYEYDDKNTINGDFHQIMSLPYECIDEGPVMKYDRKKLRNPIEIIKKR